MFQGTSHFKPPPDLDSMFLKTIVQYYVFDKLAWVVQTLDSAIHRITHYPTNKY